MSIRFAPLLVVVLSAGWSAAAAQPSAAVHTAVRAASPPRTAVGAERLTALTPGRPLAYFELAEEVAAEDTTAEGRELARRLYTLALLAPSRYPEIQTSTGVGGVAGGERAMPPWLGSSACLGLAALAQTEQERRWLTALAGTLAPVDVAPAVRQQSEAAAQEPAALELATALGLIRSGEGRRGGKLLEKPAVAALLSRYERLMNPGGLSGGGDRVRALAERFAVCPECRNRRHTRSAEGIRLCNSCGGRPGPKLTVSETVGQLRLESLLLNGVQRSWAAQVVADGGAPMRELDPEAIADAYGIDPARALWRDGEWVAADASGLAPAKPAAPDGAEPPVDASPEEVPPPSAPADRPPA